MDDFSLSVLIKRVLITKKECMQIFQDQRFFEPCIFDWVSNSDHQNCVRIRTERAISALGKSFWSCYVWLMDCSRRERYCRRPAEKVIHSFFFFLEMEMKTFKEIKRPKPYWSIGKRVSWQGQPVNNLGRFHPPTLLSSTISFFQNTTIGITEYDR